MRALPIQKFTIHGSSMFPTLKPGQDVLVFHWAYIFTEPKKGDIVVIKKNDTAIVKRIGQITSDRNIFVQGDNADESTDSRSFGPIDKSEIIGKVIFINK